MFWLALEWVNKFLLIISSVSFPDKVTKNTSEPGISTRYYVSNHVSDAPDIGKDIFLQYSEPISQHFIQ